MQRAKLFTTIMMLMVMSLSTSVQESNNEPATTATGTVISAELQKILDEDEDLKQAFDEVNPEDALHFSEGPLEEISSVEAFCFDKHNRVMMLWSENFPEGVMIWGPGLRYSFLAEIKKGNISIERTSYVPEIKSTTVWTPMGKLNPKCDTKGKNKNHFYCIKR